MKIQTTIEQWHKLLQQQKPELLDKLLAEDVTFHSPVLHTPQEGKELTSMYLGAAFHVLFTNEFHYTKQIFQDNQAMLEFETIIDGITINGVDIISCDDDSKIIEFKVMIRPAKGLQKLHEKMMQMLQQPIQRG